MTFLTRVRHQRAEFAVTYNAALEAPDWGFEVADALAPNRTSIVGHRLANAWRAKSTIPEHSVQGQQC
jgi:hypothetical protein